MPTPSPPIGGIVGLNRPLDVETAKAIVSTFIEAVIAPAVEPAAREVLARKANMRVVTADFSAFKSSDSRCRPRASRCARFSAAFWCRRAIASSRRGSPWTADALPHDLRVVTRRQPTADEWEALRFAWRICAHVKSNAVIFTDASRTLAIGAGQMSRVDAVNVAAMKARPRARTQPAARRIGRGVGRVLPVPRRPRRGRGRRRDRRRSAGRSVRDAEVIAAADEHGLAMVFTGKRHFRH